MNKFQQHNTTCAPNFVMAAALAVLSQEGGEDGLRMSFTNS